MVVSPFTAAEADYLILGRLGLGAELAYLDDLALTYTVAAFDVSELKQVKGACAQYGDLRIGLADASVVVLAAQRSTRTIATHDSRHFRAIEPLQGGTFRLLPSDL